MGSWIMAPVNEFENYFIPQTLLLLDITGIYDEAV